MERTGNASWRAVVEKDVHQRRTGASRLRAAKSSTATICSRVTSYCSMISSMDNPSSRSSKTAATGIRVPRKTHAPLTFPAALSTAGHSLSAVSLVILAMKRGGDGRGPVRKMIERLRVGRIEVQWCDGNGAGKNSGVVRVCLHVLIDFLLEEPEITAAARIFPFAQLIARDFLRLPRKFHAAVPRLRDIHVEQDLVLQSFFQNHFRGSPRHA